MIDEMVSYEYDAGGLRTQLTLPGGLNVRYTYDAKGQLVSLTDWDGQMSYFLYDAAGRQVVTQRSNGLMSHYAYDAGGRLRELRHYERGKTLARFLYALDKRGNRTQAFEELAVSSLNNTIDKDGRTAEALSRSLSLVPG
jgi:YD repeat-containing protein